MNQGAFSPSIRLTALIPENRLAGIMIQLALYVAAGLFLALVGWAALCILGSIVLQIFGALFTFGPIPAPADKPKSSAFAQEPMPDLDARRAAAFAKRIALAGPRRNEETLVQYYDRLQSLKLA